MQIQQLFKNHAIFRTFGDAAMIAFEAGSISDRRMVPRIHRYYLPQDRPPAIDHGRVFGAGLGIPCALLINATPGNLIQIVEWNPNRGHMSERIYRIGPDFEVIPVQSKGREISRGEIEVILDSSPADVAGDLELKDRDVRPLFSSSQPPWLQRIVDAQLNHWRTHNVGKFSGFTPWPVNEDDIRRCVKAAPYWALARWKDRLQPFQLNICIRNSPRGAISFAIERVPPCQRMRSLDKFPSDALMHAADKLTDAEVLRAADKEPASATSCACRRKLPPKLRATVLAGSYRKFRRGRIREPILELQEDFLNSIVEFPKEWLAGHQVGGFAAIMEGLALHLCIQPEGLILSEMHKRLALPYQHAFGEYIGSLI